MDNSKTNPNDLIDHATNGLTKREYFAALAVQGMSICQIDYDREDVIATEAVKIADALIAALNKAKV